MTKVNPQIDESWKELLGECFESAYFIQLKNFLLEEKKQFVVYPPGKEIFAAFNHTSPENVKVVIVGQDPYHGHGQANGLCFSVAKGFKNPPSLKNIFKEMVNDLNCPSPEHGDLSHWAKQGVLLLNATLTVRATSPASHQGKGWEQFTDTVIKKIAAHHQGIVFLLWGKPAQQKENLIDSTKHFVLKAAHPSPFSAHNGFFGCKHFSKTNDLLIQQGKNPINWCEES
jgi:uracil-DNA glycosylase